MNSRDTTRAPHEHASAGIRESCKNRRLHGPAAISPELRVSSPASSRCRRSRMKKRLSVPPTKSALLQVGREARFLEQGRQMLEKKRDLLTRLVYERLAQYRELRAQTQ